jgi:cytochrome c oxidase cbb3-type subunit I/II
MVFSLMLIAPSWGGMLNGLLTLRGAWDKVRQDPVLKFMVVAVTAYGMSTLEGPLLVHQERQRAHALHRLDHRPRAHRRPRLERLPDLRHAVLADPALYQTKLWSTKLANYHFWIGTAGHDMFYAVPVLRRRHQSLMWKQFTADGFLQYPNFLETVLRIIPMHRCAPSAAALYMTLGRHPHGVNLLQDRQVQGKFLAEEEVQAAALARSGSRGSRKPLPPPLAGTQAPDLHRAGPGGHPDRRPDRDRPDLPDQAPTSPPSPPCGPTRRSNCRAATSTSAKAAWAATARWSGPSAPRPNATANTPRPGEYVYDHPFLWGSKRTGPDLHRVGKKYPHAWHYNHMEDPNSTSPGSIMPPYPWLLTRKLDTKTTQKKITLMRKLGVPYPDGYEFRRWTT